MSEIFFTADTHFHHRAMSAEGRGWRPFDTMTEHDEYLIERWNKTVRPGDQVWHLGDVGMGSEEKTLETVRRLNGEKHLITGNHDPVWPGHRDAHKRQRRWLEVFTSVQAYARRRVAKESFLLSHFPYKGSGDHTEDERYSEYRLNDTGLWLVHGHVHDAWDVRDRQLNVGVDVRSWRPVALHEIIKIMHQQEGREAA